MNPELARMARQSITIHHSMDISSQGIAERAIHACEVLSKHLTTTLGKHGFCTIFKRCAQRLPTWNSPRHTGANPWSGVLHEDQWRWMQVSLEQQDSTMAAVSFLLLLSDVITLVARLVGDVAMKALVEDVWAVAFPQIFEECEQPTQDSDAATVRDQTEPGFER
jgi:hypothetical protein